MKNLNKKSLFVLALFLLPTFVWSQGQNGTTLTSSISACSKRIKQCEWTIDKTVTPANWVLFRGDQGTSEYKIEVTKTCGEAIAYITGEVCVTNGGAVDTEGLSITVILGYPPLQAGDEFASTSVDVSINPVLSPGETGCYPYSVAIPVDKIDITKTYKVTANITITNHSGYLGQLFGPSPSATTSLTEVITSIHGDIQVDDTNGSSWNFSDSGSASYSKTFTCNSDQGEHHNVASITYLDDQTAGPSDYADVTVDCYDLNISKTANTSFTRTYKWSVDKSADLSSLVLSTGQTFVVNYTVLVTLAGFTDSDWAAAGTIALNNPAPIAATINGVTDFVSPDVAVTPNFGVTFPYILAAGETLNGTYTVALPDASSRTNTANATMQNYSYDKNMNATANGTTDYAAAADVNFASANVNFVDECVNVTDSYAGTLGTICSDMASSTFTYSRTVGSYAECGDYAVDNTATITTNDTGATASDSWAVGIHVPCAGCTLTPGYWKTHSIYGPAPYDDTWLQVGENTAFFLSGKSYYQVLWTPPAGNAYYILAHAYIAAKMNVLNGADAAVVATAFAKATTLFNTYTPAQVAAMKTKDRQAWTDLATILDNYNNGLIGPGHCSESPALKDAQLSDEAAIPGKAALTNYPNPFSQTTTFAFYLPSNASVTLTVLNMNGQTVATVFNGNMNQGGHTVNWTAPGNLAAGVYMYKLTTDGTSQVGVLVIKK